ncbi:MAG TPA: hypothetical protein VGQ41_24210 [Pyrinomonadaceae bacterium]|jgi:hypothetical protein|nr:hypothetical protein [Pyrinomonadaceae bacterium]
MTQNSFWKTLVFALVVLGTSASLMGQSSVDECDAAQDRDTPIYKVVRTRRASDETPALTLFVKVQPAFFNADAMRGLGRALNRRFCKDRTIEAIIVDDERAATKWDPFHVPELYESAIRGSYFLDRESGKEYVAFSNARGRGFDEFVSLGPTTQQPSPRTYTNAYQNLKYRYSLVVPASFAGTSTVPKEDERGINIAISSDQNRYIWVGATENVFQFSSLWWATTFQRFWIEADGSKIVSFAREPHYRLGYLKGTRLTVRYKRPGADKVLVKDFVLALKSNKNDVGTLYRVEMASTEKDYNSDKKTFEQIAKSWRSK